MRIQKVTILFCTLLIPFIMFSQESKDSSRSFFKFTGTVSVTTNGISPIPAFSLDKPAITAFLKIVRKRVSLDPEFGFSTKGIPWFVGTCFRYKAIDKPRFILNTGVIWGLGFSYPQLKENGKTNIISKAERFAWLDIRSKYIFSKTLSVGSNIWNGYNFEKGSVKRIHYLSLNLNVDDVKLKGAYYFKLYPQLFYLNLDETNDGFFASATGGIGQKKWGLFLSTQFNQTVITNISPSPGFKWNISLDYSF